MRYRLEVSETTSTYITYDVVASNPEEAEAKLFTYRHMGEQQDVDELWTSYDNDGDVEVISIEEMEDA